MHACVDVPWRCTPQRPTWCCPLDAWTALVAVHLCQLAHGNVFGLVATVKASSERSRANAARLASNAHHLVAWLFAADFCVSGTKALRVGKLR